MSISEGTMLTIHHLRAALKVAQDEIRHAHDAAGGEDYGERQRIGIASRSAYESLLVIVNALQLEHVVANLKSTMAKCDADGLSTTSQNDEGDKYSVAAAELSYVCDAIASLFGQRPHDSEREDLTAILKEANYYINDKKVFPTSPKDEREVHDRIEGILSCVFPHLQREAVLSKSIKSFRIDTGLPSISTILEYKYLSRKKDAPRFVEQMLADSKGYHDPKWRHILFVVYETSRFYSVKKWNEMLAENDSDDKASIFVLEGEEFLPPRTPPKRSKKAKPTN